MFKLRLTALALVGMLLLGTAGCGGGGNDNADRGAPPPMTQDAPQRQGMSTKQKVLLVAGAAALYYMYKKHQNAKGSGKDGTYYRSKNGRIYYRDSKGNPVWVTEPTEPMSIPADEYERVTGQRVGGDGIIRQAPAGW
jgi:hypothetical protein